MGIVSGGSGGGGPAAGSYLPSGSKTGVTLDTTTYNDPVRGGGAKLNTLVYATEGAALAVAQAGDAFPRWLLTSDASDGFYGGRGNVDPYSGPAAGFYVDSSRRFIIGAQNTSLTVGGIDPNVGDYIGVGSPFFLQPVFIQSGPLDPTASFGGNVGDLYIRTDANLILYQCTSAGVAGAATWGPVLQPGSPKGIITSGALPTVTITSGTGRQVSTARDVETVTPVTFNPGAATTATCKVELSPDNVTYSTLGTETEPAGVAFDGTIHLIKVRVPAGWYLKLTVTNATLGTTTYY